MKRLKGAPIATCFVCRSRICGRRANVGKIVPALVIVSTVTPSSGHPCITGSSSRARMRSGCRRRGQGTAPASLGLRGVLEAVKWRSRARSFSSQFIWVIRKWKGRNKKSTVLTHRSAEPALYAQDG